MSIFGDGFLSDLLRTGGEYYLGESEQDAARELGQRAFDISEAAGTSAAEQAAFQPFTVTSSLATGTTTPEGGLRLDLSPAEQRRQQERFRQAEALYGTIGADPRRIASEYYENIRAAQRPEEERDRLAMQQGLFSTGRGGISSAQFGGTPEQFAFEKARAEAQLGAGAKARELALAERDQQLKAAGLLTEEAYRPQREAIDLFGASSIPSQIAGRGRDTGATLASQLTQTGLESLLQGERIASDLSQQQQRDILDTLVSERGTGGQFSGVLPSLFAEDGLLGGLGLGGLFTGGRRYSDEEIQNMTPQQREDALYDIFN